MADLDDVWRDDRLVEAAARGDLSDPDLADDPAAGPLLALSRLADARPLPRLDVDPAALAALAEGDRSRRYAVRSLAVAVAAVTTLSTSGVAAVVTGDPFRPAKAVWHQIQGPPPERAHAQGDLLDADRPVGAATQGYAEARAPAPEQEADRSAAAPHTDDRDRGAVTAAPEPQPSTEQRSAPAEPAAPAERAEPADEPGGEQAQGSDDARPAEEPQPESDGQPAAPEPYAGSDPDDGDSRAERSGDDGDDGDDTDDAEDPRPPGDGEGDGDPIELPLLGSERPAADAPQGPDGSRDTDTPDQDARRSGDVEPDETSPEPTVAPTPTPRAAPAPAAEEPLRSTGSPTDPAS